jgi:hypothetical protein
MTNLTANSATLPKRSKKYSVHGRPIGKTIGYNTWVHRQYEHVFQSVFLVAAKTRIPADFDYAVVKYNSKTHAVSFIESPDFDTADEPLVGSAIRVIPTKKPKLIRASVNPLIYHHKWLMVDDTYLGFDVQASKQRSIKWKSIVGVNKVVSSRIGRQGYWRKEVVPLLIQKDLERSAKTAMTRKALSRPTRFLLHNDHIKGSVLHHGCGKARDDSYALQRQAILANKTYAEYDPGHAPYDRSILDQKYTTVVSNYVMNTLPKEARLCVWRDLTRCTGKTAYVTIRQDKIKGEPFKDGFLTGKKTFQVYIPEKDFLAEAENHFPLVDVFYKNSSLLMLRCRAWDMIAR